jgi:branched-chain amino acid transport system substrate-binding protein
MLWPHRAVTALLAMLVVAGCAAPATTQPTPTGAAPTPSPTATPRAELKLGAALAMTGFAASFGQAQKQAIELAAKDINARQDGPRVTVVVEDTASDPRQAITVFQKLINVDRVAAILGPTSTQESESADPIAQQAKVPVVAISNTGLTLLNIGDHIFRVSMSEASVIPNAVKYVKQQSAATRAAIIWGSDDDFTKSGHEVFLKAFGTEAIPLVSDQSFAKGDLDFTAQLTNIRSQNPQVLAVSAQVQEGALILQQARRLGINATMIGGNAFNNPLLIQQAGAAAEGVIVGAAWDSTAPGPRQQFIEAYRSAYSAAPNQFAAQAYEAVFILHDAAKVAQTSTDRSAIRDGLLKVRRTGVLGDFSFFPTREPNYTPMVQQIKNGAYVVVGR